MTAVLSVDNGGNLNLGAQGIVTVPYMNNTWAPTNLKLMDSASTTRQLTSTTTGLLVWNGAVISNTFAAGLPLQITQTSAGTLTFDTLWKPSSVTVSTGIIAVSSNTLGTLSLSLDGTESRTQLKLQDSGGTVRNLTADTSGNVLYNSTALATQTWSNSQLQPLLVGVTQSGSGTSLETKYASKLKIDASTLGSSQADFVFKFNSGFVCSVFANSSYWGWIPQAGQIFRMYNAQSSPALEVLATSNTVSIPGALNVSGTNNIEIKHPNTNQIPDESKERMEIGGIVV